MKITLTSVLLLAALFGAATIPQGGTPQESLLILSKTDQTLAIVDPHSLKILARVPVGNDPHEVIASTDGRTAYVSNYGSGAYNTLAVVDLVAQKALPSIDLGALRGPHGLTFVDGKLWFTAEAAKAIARLDPATNKVDWIFGTGQNRTHMIYVWPDAQRVVTTNVSSATVSIIEHATPIAARGGPPPGPVAASELGAPPPGRGPGRGPQGPPGGDWTQTVIPVGPGSEGFDLSPDRAEIWVANAGDGTISIISVAEKRVVETINAGADGANRLKFTPDGKHVLVGDRGDSHAGGALIVLDVAARKVIKVLQIGHGAEGIVMAPDGSRAFVACSPDNNVAVIVLASLELAGRIDAGGNPDGMAWAIRR
jgi:DNA-binding beta-propeller fold protein YncE